MVKIYFRAGNLIFMDKIFQCEFSMQRPFQEDLFMFQLLQHTIQDSIYYPGNIALIHSWTTDRYMCVKVRAHLGRRTKPSTWYHAEWMTLRTKGGTFYLKNTS